MLCATWLGLSTYLLAACGGGSSADGKKLRSDPPPLCPTTAHERRLPANGWPPARTQLAPPGALQIRLCRYSGLNQTRPAGRLLRSRLLTNRAVVAELVREFDGLGSAPPGPVACPNDDGSIIRALLTYPLGQSVTIQVSRTGCQSVTNGDVTAVANGYGTPAGPRLERRLDSLTAPDKIAAAACPRAWIERSSPSTYTGVASGSPTWTTLCVYGRSVARRSFRGGPLDEALNDYYPTALKRLVCPAIAVAPLTVVLTYKTMVRYVAVDMGGCPAIIVATGARQTLRQRAAAAVFHYWAETVKHG